VHGDVVATAAVCAGAMGDGGAALRAAVPATLDFLARVTLRGGALATAAVRSWTSVLAVAAMHAAAHTSSRVSRCQVRKSRAGRPASAQT